MAPPFLLEYYKGPRTTDRNKRTIYTKNVYNNLVKVSDWQDFYQSLPIDKDPYFHDGPDYHKSHYSYLGQEKCICYATETSDMLRQCHNKDKYIDTDPQKKVINYFSFKDSTNCKEPNYKMFPSVCADDYVSTTHKSFTTPFPYPMKRLSIPKVSFLETRRFEMKDPNFSDKKFYDDDLVDTIKLLQKHKSHRFNSYNFCTGYYQDGSLPEEKIIFRKKLEYD